MTSYEPSPVVLASIQRASASEVRQQVAKVTRNEALAAALEILPSPVLVVNDHRQIIFANQAMADLVGAEKGADLIGMRSGEALHCHHVNDGEAGCGTSPFCRYCGAARAIAEAGSETESYEEAFILREFGQVPLALDLEVVTRTFVLEGERFTMMTITDISGEKRRQSMERIFFHDVLNTVQKMRIAADLLLEEDGTDELLLRQMIMKSVGRLTEEILAQRDLADMENGESAVKPTQVHSQELLADLVESYLEYSLTQGQQVQIAAETQDVIFVTDETKLRRVLDNMLKNALEAEGSGATITIGCRTAAPDAVEFWVHNSSVMPEAVRWQVFKRSFSTKGQGRGLGTYSMRVLTERYLEGEISFSSEPEAGTTFRARYPLCPSYA